MTTPDTERKPRGWRTPVESVVHRINEAASRAKDAGLTFDEFIGAAVWAGRVNELWVSHPAFTAELINDLLASNEWHVVEAKMAEEKSS